MNEKTLFRSWAGRILRSSIPYCVFIFILFEAVIGPKFREHMVYPERPGRNVFYRFNWPQYVTHKSFLPSTEKARNDRRIVILGNSQAYGYLLPAEKVWPALLETKLNNDPVVNTRHNRICNWAHVGGNVRHLAILDCYVQEARADHCLVVITLGGLNPNFPMAETKLNPNTYDLAYLLYEKPSQRLPRRFRESAGSLNLYIEWVYSRLLPTYPYKRVPLSWLANNLPVIPCETDEEQVDTGAPLARGSYVRIPLFAKNEFEGWYCELDPVSGEKQMKAEHDDLDWVKVLGKNWLLGSMKPVEDFFETMGKSEVPHTIVLMPLWEGRLFVPEKDKEFLAGKLDELSNKHGIPVVDLSASLPPEFFFEPFHLNYAGNEKMAEMIQKVLEDRGVIPRNPARQA